MDRLDESTKNNMGFFKHVFNFDDDSKSDMLNIIQYSLIALVPIILLNKAMQKYVPEAEEEKGSLELLAEIVIQIIVMFLGILMVNRIVTYIPTYSGVKYPEFNVNYIILAVLVITLSLQTKLGEKVSILFDRVVELWEGKSKDNKKKGKNGNGSVKVSQPISQNANSMAMSQSLYNDGGSTPISQLPEQSMPDYNSMNRNDNTPLIGASTPGKESMMNLNNQGMNGGFPMAANELLGGSAFGSNF